MHRLAWQQRQSLITDAEYETDERSTVNKKRAECKPTCLILFIKKMNFTRWNSVPAESLSLTAMEDNTTERSLPTRRTKWRLYFAILVGVISIFQIAFINTASIKVDREEPKDTVTSGNLAVLYFEAPYRDLDPSGNHTWQYRWHLHSSCVTNDYFGPYCIGRAPGKPFDIAPLFEHVDTSNANATWRNPPPPSKTTSNIHLKPIQDIVPFIIYATGVGVELVTLWIMAGRHRPRLLGTCLMALTSLLYLIASAWLTSLAKSAIRELKRNSMADSLIQNAHVGSGFLAMTWTAVFETAFVALVFAWEWRRWTSQTPAERQRELDIRQQEDEEAARRREEEYHSD